MNPAPFSPFALSAREKASLPGHPISSDVHSRHIWSVDPGTGPREPWCWLHYLPAGSGICRHDTDLPVSRFWGSRFGVS